MSMPTLFVFFILTVNLEITNCTLASKVKLQLFSSKFVLTIDSFAYLYFARPATNQSTFTVAQYLICHSNGNAKVSLGCRQAFLLNGSHLFRRWHHKVPRIFFDLLNGSENRLKARSNVLYNVCNQQVSSDCVNFRFWVILVICKSVLSFIFYPLLK